MATTNELSRRETMGRQGMYRTLRDAWIVAWPVLCVFVIVLILLVSYGHGSILDASTWPAIEKTAQECADKPDARVYVRIATYYSIVSFGAALFLFFNSCSFTARVRKISQCLSVTTGNSNETLQDISLWIRVFSIGCVMLWLAKLSVIDPKLLAMNIDEWLILLTFAFCGIADAIILIVLWRQGKRELWSANRELLGALCYIDIPTFIGVGLIARYGPALLLGSNTPDMMFKAICGGAMIIHVVTSQVILSFLVAEEKISTILEKHWEATP